MAVVSNSYLYHMQKVSVYSIFITPTDLFKDVVENIEPGVAQVSYLLYITQPPTNVSVAHGRECTGIVATSVFSGFSSTRTHDGVHKTNNGLLLAYGNVFHLFVQDCTSYLRVIFLVCCHFCADRICGSCAGVEERNKHVERTTQRVPSSMRRTCRSHAQR